MGPCGLWRTFALAFLTLTNAILTDRMSEIAFCFQIFFDSMTSLLMCSAAERQTSIQCRMRWISKQILEIYMTEISENVCINLQFSS